MERTPSIGRDHTASALGAIANAWREHAHLWRSAGRRLRSDVAHGLNAPRCWWRRLRRPRIVTLEGVRLDTHVLPPDTRRRVWAGRYERGESRCVKAAVDPDDVVLECGSGIGFVTTLCALRARRGRVVTYEANAALLPTLHRVFELNGVTVAVRHGVVGPGNGPVEFFVEDHVQSSSVSQRTDGARSVVVMQFDINQVIEEVRPTVLVMDVEGAEGTILPAIEWQRATVQKIVLELHPRILGEERLDRTIRALVEAGFVEDRWLSTRKKKLFRRKAGIA